MTPDQLAKSGTEHAHQVALFAYCAVARLHGWEIADQWAEKGAAALLGRTVPNVTKAVPALEWFHAIPNGGARGDDAKSRAIRGGALKAEGVRAGVPDCFLPWPVHVRDAQNEPHIQWCGLYIEMKKPTEKPKREGSKGGVSDDQAEFGEYAKRLGYGWAVCYSWREAVEILRSYIEWGQ